MTDKIRIFALFLILLFLILPFKKTNAENEINIQFFWAEGCPHCAKEKIFLEKIRNKYPQITILDYEVSRSRENIKKLQEIGEKFSADVSGVPFTVIGDRYFSGYLSDETTGEEIKKTIDEQINKNGPGKKIQEKENTNYSLKVPFLGEINKNNVSLPTLTFVLAILDGFNPCAMWVLIFLITLLIGMKDRKKMWTLGIIFIISSAMAYFLFLTAWLNIFIFFGFIKWIRVLIGLVAIFAGFYYLKDYIKNKNGSCKVIMGKQKKKIIESLKNIVREKKLIFALFGIISLAFIVNLVELVCSAGLPAIYTGVLSLSNLSKLQYYSYLIGYIFIFMLDDLIIFFAAMITLKVTGFQGKYSRYAHLIGGLLMLIIGLAMLFKPKLLMFG